MRAAKSSATLETCDCSVLTIRRKAATRNTAAAALRNGERWKAHPEEPFRGIQFWHVISTSSLACTVVVGRFLTS